MAGQKRQGGGRQWRRSQREEGFQLDKVRSCTHCFEGPAWLCARLYRYRRSPLARWSNPQQRPASSHGVLAQERARLEQLLLQRSPSEQRERDAAHHALFMEHLLEMRRRLEAVLGIPHQQPSPLGLPGQGGGAGEGRAGEVGGTEGEGHSDSGYSSGLEE